MALQSTISKVFNVHKLSPAIKERLRQFRLSYKQGGLLQLIQPWIVIADTDYSILFTSAKRPSQLQSPYFLGNIEVEEFSTENDTSTIFLSTGNLKVKVLNKEIVNNSAIYKTENKLFNLLLSLGQEIIIIVGQSDISPPNSSIEVKRIVNDFKDVINKGVDSLYKDQRMTKQMVFLYSVVEPQMSLEPDSTISLNIRLMGSTTVYLKSITVSDDEFTELFNSALTQTVGQLLGKTTPPLRPSNTAFLADTNRFVATLYNGSDFLNAIKSLEETFKNTDVFEYLKKIISKLPIETEGNFSTPILTNVQCDSLIRFGDFMDFLNERIVAIYNDEKIKLDFKIESYPKRTPVLENSTEIISSTANYVLSFNPSVSFKDPTIDTNKTTLKTKFGGREIFTYKSTNNKVDYSATVIRNLLLQKVDNDPNNDPRVNLEDVLIPLNLFKCGLDETKTKNTTTLSIYLSRVIEKINSFYEDDRFILDVREEGNTIIFFERKTHEENVTANIVEESNDAFMFDLFDDQGIIMEHSINLELPSNELQGVILNKDYISPALLVRKLEPSQIIDYGNYIATNNGVNQISNILKYINAGKEEQPTGMVRIKIPDAIQIFCNRIALLKGTHISIKESITDNKTLELLQMYCKNILTFVYRNAYKNGHWLSISGAEGLIEKSKFIISKTKRDPLFNLFLSSMFRGSITIPGIGNIWQYQAFSLRTGIRTYDLMQGILPEDKTKMFWNVITGVSHNITPQAWTTTIEFTKTAYGSQLLS